MPPTSHPALELAATIRSGPGGERDALEGPRGLDAWLRGLGIEQPGLELRLADFRELRAAIRSLLDATVEGRPLPPDAAAAVNAASAAASVHARLELDGMPRAVEVEAGPPAARVFAAIARSAIEIAGGPDRDRLRRCPAPGCGRFFVTTRARRTWCGDACGNRVRVARHHARRRDTRSARPQAGRIRSTAPESDRA